MLSISHGENIVSKLAQTRHLNGTFSNTIYDTLVHRDVRQTGSEGVCKCGIRSDYLKLVELHK
jgi:hypothetical protein